MADSELDKALKAARGPLAVGWTDDYTTDELVGLVTAAHDAIRAAAPETADLLTLVAEIVYAVAER
jgi:hypothetical protein